MNRLDNDPKTQSSGTIGESIIYDRGTIKVVVFACCIIVLAVILTGSISYYITRNAVVDKLKSRDIVFIIESIAAKIDGRIGRAKETSLILAKDPTIVQWIDGEEKDELLGRFSKKKINAIAADFDYANSFIVSAKTNHYWAEGSRLIQIMSETDPDAKWFFDALKSGKPINLNIDYNSGRQDTFVFLNALVGNAQRPIAVTGVGLSLKELAQEFQQDKFGKNSNLWLVDGTGKIHLSDDITHNGKYLNDFVPLKVSSQIIKDMNYTAATPKIIEYVNTDGAIFDLAYRTTKSTDWKLVFQLPRSESIAFLGNIKLNTAIASFVALTLMIFVFYIVSRRIADPLKRALLITKEMEKQVTERTRELAEQNQKIIDSIDYAKRLQESILATQDELEKALGDYFIVWKPRDLVGGDLYWVRQINTECSLVAVIDCTGHGVPGAFMTMAVNSVLNHIIDQGILEPADILAKLNMQLKATLHRSGQDRLADDGLDIGICRINNNKQLIFAGAKIPLYIKRGCQVYTIMGNKKSIGYRRSSGDLEFTNHNWQIEAGDRFYLITDGYIDQNGGERDFPFGRTRLIQAIIDQSETKLSQQREAFESLLNEYMGSEAQRDDITMVGFSVQ